MATSYSARDLDLVPSVDFSFVEQFIKSNKESSGQKSINKGFKYYSEGYIEDLNVTSLSDGNEVSGRCYRSQKRNETPHQVKVCFGKDDQPSITKAWCNCPIGLSGACGHITGLLYQLADYKARGLKALPEDIARTSQPCTWFEKRGEKIRGKAMQDVTVRGYKKTTPGEATAPRAVQSTLYNPLRNGPIDWPSMYEKLSEAASDLLILPAIKSNPPKVSTSFGPAPRGSVLSYQQPLESDCIINLLDGVGFPDLPVENFMQNSYASALTSAQAVSMEGVKLSLHEIRRFEEQTRLQSQNPLWFRLRKHRITASRVGEIYKRRKNYETLTTRLKSTRKVTTAAMMQGLASEPTATKAYAEACENKINIYPCGVIVSFGAPWIAASPDRKVYNPERFPAFGLLEVKCPQVGSVLETKYLKKDVTGTLKLERNHNYYFQVLTQLAVTGLEWCDFFVWCQNDHHLETIYFNAELWAKVKDKIDIFYFTSFI